MASDSVDAAVLASTLKSGHSLSLDGHYSNVSQCVNPKSRMIAKMRSIPKIPCDTSFEAVQESVNRTVLHKIVCDSDPHAFRR